MRWKKLTDKSGTRGSQLPWKVHTGQWGKMGKKGGLPLIVEGRAGGGIKRGKMSVHRAPGLPAENLGRRTGCEGCGRRSRPCAPGAGHISVAVAAEGAHRGLRRRRGSWGSWGRSRNLCDPPRGAGNHIVVIVTAKGAFSGGRRRDRGSWGSWDSWGHSCGSWGRHSRTNLLLPICGADSHIVVIVTAKGTALPDARFFIVF